MNLDTTKLRRLGVHDGIAVDDFCDFAVELRNELLHYPRWKVFRLGANYGFQTGITTGHIEDRYPELVYCHRFERELLAHGLEVCGLVGAQPGGELRVDFSAMAYGQGGLLRAHTDETGLRYVAWILYLTHPDEGEWTGDDGGHLELLVDPAEPTAERAVLAPRFNRFTAFRVAERSWHAITPIRRETTWERCRLALAGWLDGRVSEVG